MSKLFRIILVSVLLAASYVGAYLIPVTPSSSPDVLSGLNVPQKFTHWDSRDISNQLNIKDERYKFQSRVIARQYANDLGENLLCLVVDGQNFHHPRNCYLSSGFNVRTLDPITMTTAGGHTFEARALFMSKESESTLVVYWVCLDKKIVDWTEQKFTQLYYALFSKNKVGIMGRLDISTTEDRLDQSIKLSQEFVRAVSKSMPDDQVDYLFGA